MNNIGAVAQELAEIISMSVLPIPDNTMIDTAEGIFLDRKALDFNEARNASKSSVGILEFTGTEGTIIPAGTVATSDYLEFVTTKETMILPSGTCEVCTTATTEGQSGNVAALKIETLKLYMDGVRSVINPEPFTGGVDEESDTSFRERVLEKIRKPITSGNKNHYIYWTKQVSGVGKAKAISCWNGNGTVKIIVLSDQYDVPDDNLIQKVIKNIEENRPIGAEVTVSKAIPLSVNVSITVVLAKGYVAEDIKKKITISLEAYLKSISFDETKHLSYYKIGDIIFNVEGVSDITNYTLNNAAISIQTTFEEFFKLQEVLLNGY